MVESSSAQLSYRDRLDLIRRKKIEQTQEKIARFGPLDEDDYGTVAPPADFDWKPIPNHPCGSFFGAAGWAANFRSLMEVHPIYVDPLEAIAGRWMFALSRRQPVTWMPEFDYSALKADQEKYGIMAGIGSSSHFGPDYRIGLALGWSGLLAKVRHCRQLHGPDKAAFYQAEEDVILGVQTWIRRTVQAIRQRRPAEVRPQFARNLDELAEMNDWLIDHPPRTMREACQWLAWFNMASRTYNRDGAGGQLDELLRPYYERDVADGVLDDEGAIFCIACLLLNDTHYYQIGGPGPDGADLTSHVSFLILEAAHRLGTSNNLTVRVHDGLNREFFLKSVRHLFEDRQGWPRFAGDKGLVEGFMRNGYSAELARQRIGVGCHWFAIPGREYPLNDIVKINTAKVFEVAFWEMMQDSAAAPSVKGLWRRFEDHLRQAVWVAAKGLDFHLDHQKDNQPELMLNLLCHGPIEKGSDASAGGVDYYNMCVDGTALATVADSFAACQQRIEREGVLSWPRLAEHLQNDFAEAEGQRVRMMLTRSEKFGRGGSLGDQWAARVSSLLARLVKEQPTPGGRTMIPGWFSWSATIRLGHMVGATPNGRKAQAPISHGANPDPGFRKDNAPTAMAKAIAAIQCGYGNACPMQLELDPGLIEQGAEKLAALIQTHFDLGGTLLNINIIDRAKLLAADKDPHAFPDLVVRVTGFTAYFAALSPQFRQLVISRIIAE